MMRTPMVRIAIHFDIASEISAPPKPKQRREYQQAVEAAALLGQPGVEAGDLGDDRQHQHDREVRHEKKKYALHGNYRQGSA